MAFTVLRFEHQQRIQWGVLSGQRITPIPGQYPSTGDFVRSQSLQQLKDLLQSASPSLDAASVRVLSPVTSNQQFVCQGANYRQHMIESGLNPDDKPYNMIFTKASSCIVAADSPVVRPRAVKFLDYEIELGLVLKRDLLTATEIGEHNLHEFVAGLVIVNDYSARDVQIPQMQFYKGKSFRTFGPVGPYLCLLERHEMHYLKDMQLELTVNGQVRQRDGTANLVWGPAETLSELAGVHDLHAGDLIATGTPAGCALSVPSPAKQRIAALLPERTKWNLFHKIQAGRGQYLKPGDLVQARIRSSDGAIDLGVQSNRVVEEA
jgi:2-keto-4-pentenoate hydratase/2-oxohepta-3-ene-1,7-dioic acid hydratase in catechol pathway